MSNDNIQILRLIAQNPFRALGVYINASQRDILANARKIKALSKVGKDIEYPCDILLDYPKIVRNVDTIEAALNTLSFNAERFKASLFWFTNSTPFDNFALQHLFADNSDKAISIWNRTDSITSLHNRSIAAAIKQDWRLFATSASELFEMFPRQVCETFGAENQMTSEELMFLFLKTINEDNPTIIDKLYACSLKV
ncbi:MAG: hypothetical protein ACI31C_01760, partial [Muribaculaceae bacterium]